MKKILHIIPSVSAGGIESLVVSLYENIDREKYQFDFAVFNPNNPIHKKRLEELGAEIYFIADAGSKSNLLSKISWRIKALYNFFRLVSKNDYDVLHCHNYNGYNLYILLAALKGIPTRIVHSHSTNDDRKSFLVKVSNKLKKLFSFNWLITSKLACSKMAAEWLYGKDSVLEDPKTRVIYNGINMNKFSSENKNIKKIREKYEINDGIHFINVGRFSHPKNQLFLLDVFYELTKNKKKVFLHIVGYGSLEKKLKNKVKELNLENKVTFYKYNTDIPELLSVMDFFLLPSNFEGLPITAIEAQASNLPIYMSKEITKEVDMGLATYLPLEKGAKYWVDYILKDIANNTYPKKIDLEKKKIFDIENVAKEFEKLYD
jgi:glycosyltransferase involved in cell wall biosynthesis